MISHYLFNFLKKNFIFGKKVNIIIFAKLKNHQFLWNFFFIKKNLKKLQFLLKFEKSLIIRIFLM